MRSLAFLKIDCRALTFHIFKNLRLFDKKKIVAGLQKQNQWHSGIRRDVVVGISLDLWSESVVQVSQLIHVDI